MKYSVDFQKIQFVKYSVSNIEIKVKKKFKDALRQPKLEGFQVLENFDIWKSESIFWYKHTSSSTHNISLKSIVLELWSKEFQSH